LEDEWSSFPRARIRPFLDLEELRRIRPLIGKNFASPPSDCDVACAYLSEKALECVKYRQWGLYRNNRLSMGAVLEENGKRIEALRYYLEVSYLDLNGPQNRGRLVTDETTSVLPGMDFEVSNASLAPAVVDKIIELILVLKQDENQTRHEFIDSARRCGNEVNLPVSPDKAWEHLSSELYV
jgi:hypothetical protein